MDILKNKLLVFLSITIIFITFEDVYATECEDDLEKSGYPPQENGLNSYAASIFTAYTRYDGGFLHYDNSFKLIIKLCLGDELLNSKATIEHFFCYLLLKINNTVKISNTTTWCELRCPKIKGSKIEKITSFVERKPKKASPQELDETENCIKTLKEDGFIFNHGVDNYAYWFKVTKIETEPQKTKTDFTIMSLEYIEYLTTAVKKYDTQVYNTTKWCLVWECERNFLETKLKIHASGSENYEVVTTQYESHCNEIETETGRNYCNYLFGGSEKRNTVQLLGIFDWCDDKTKDKAHTLKSKL